MSTEYAFRLNNVSAAIAHQSAVPVSEETLKKLQTREDVRSLAFELMKEGEVFLRLSGLVLEGPDGKAVPYRRNGAALAGNLIRVHELVLSFVCQMECGHGYGARALERQINEGLINFLYLVKKLDEPKAFDQYVLGGLGNLKKGLELVKGAPAANSELMHVVQASVDYVIGTSGFTLDQIDVDKHRQWKPGVKERLKVVCDAPYRNLTAEQVADVEYMGMFAGPAGNVHGDWADIVLNHMRPVDGGFLPNTVPTWPEPDSMLRTAQYIGAAVGVFIRTLQPRTEDTDWILAALKDFLCRVDVLDNYVGSQNAQGKLLSG